MSPLIIQCFLKKKEARVAIGISDMCYLFILYHFDITHIPTYLLFLREALHKINSVA